MAIFTGKIIEAYYADPDNTTVEVIYKDGDKAINHYLTTDMGHPDFKDLVDEYPLHKLADTTIKRNKAFMSQMNRVIDGRMKSLTDEQPLKNFDSVIDFVLNYNEKTQAEQLFSLKLKIFDKDAVKDFNGSELKKKIRQAKEPLDVLMAYQEIIKKQSR